MPLWDEFKTDDYEGMIAETITMTGNNGDQLHAYTARPLGAGPFPGIVLIHHLPGWDEFYREVARRYAHHGYVVVCPNMYERFGHGGPTEIAAAARAAGGVEDSSIIGDSKAALELIKSLPYSNGKVGVIGTCSGGRHAYLVACRVPGFDAIVDCWGGRVVMGADELNERTPVAPIDMTPDLSIPLLGLFGNDDQSPSPEQVNLHEEELKKNGKDYEFHRYDGAGHGFWYLHRPNYRPEQAMDAWDKTFEFFGKHLAG